MPKTSSGLLMYKTKNNQIYVFLAHPGGIFWKNKDEGAWSIPKDEVNEGEDLLETAKREFKEEIGIKSEGNFISLGEIKQKAGKIVHAWAFEGDWNGLLMCQSYVEIEIKGRKMKIPEIGKASFFSIEEAKKKINPAQKEFIERMVNSLKIKV